jgi:hypothetical protein
MSLSAFRIFVTCPISAMMLLLIASGCGEEPGAVLSGPGAGPGASGPGPGPAAADVATLGDSPTVKQIMGKLTRGPASLTGIIGRELEADPPAWEMIQPQTQEYARLAAAMGKNEPPRGSKESWSKLTGEFASSAGAMDKAAKAKDRDAALEAHGAITGSCMNCHREHRGGGPGMGGPGMGGPGMGPGIGGPPMGPPGPRQRGARPKNSPPPGD